MPSTPIYNIPFQALTDPPDGAGLGEDGFDAVDTQLARIDALISAAASNYTASGHGILGGNRWTGGGVLVSGVTTSESLTNMATPTLVLKQNRLYRIPTKFRITYSGGTTSVIARIRDGSLVGTILAEVVVDAANSASSHTFEFAAELETSTTGLTKQFVMTLISNGAVSSINAGSAQNPTWMEVVDIGPAGVVTVLNTP